MGSRRRACFELLSFCQIARNSCANAKARLSACAHLQAPTRTPSTYTSTLGKRAFASMQHSCAVKLGALSFLFVYYL